MIYEKDIEQIKEADLQELIDKQVIEQKKLEYKSAFDSDKRDFLADVSSFANADGGIIIYGVAERAGRPVSKDGMVISDIDQEILRLESIIREGVDQRIPSVRCWPVKLKNSNYVILVKVPKSWISPHRVKSNDKFYSRTSNGKYALDVAELRIAFNLSETIAEKIRNFKQDRIAKIVSNETPVPMLNNPKIVLHLIPIISFSSVQNYDIDRVSTNRALMPPMYSTAWDNGYNLDGYLAYSQDREKKSCYSYVQLYRNGIIEAVEASLLEEDIPSIAYEQELIESFKGYILLLKGLGIGLPIFVFLALLGVKGYSMAVSEQFRGHRRNSLSIDRDILILPEVMLESYDDKAEQVLKPCFDAVWNACGFQRSLNYNKAGEWSPRQ